MGTKDRRFFFDLRLTWDRYISCVYPVLYDQESLAEATHGFIADFRTDFALLTLSREDRGQASQTLSRAVMRDHCVTFGLSPLLLADNFRFYPVFFGKLLGERREKTILPEALF